MQHKFMGFLGSCVVGFLFSAGRSFTKWFEKLLKTFVYLRSLDAKFSVVNSFGGCSSRPVLENQLDLVVSYWV